MKGQNWKELNLISLSGVYSPASNAKDSKVPVALKKYLEDNPAVSKIHIHFDNDIAGRTAANLSKHCKCRA